MCSRVLVAPILPVVREGHSQKKIFRWSIFAFCLLSAVKKIHITVMLYTIFYLYSYSLRIYKEINYWCSTNGDTASQMDMGSMILRKTTFAVTLLIGQKSISKTFWCHFALYKFRNPMETHQNPILHTCHQLIFKYLTIIKLKAPEQQGNIRDMNPPFWVEKLAVL